MLPKKFSATPSLYHQCPERSMQTSMYDLFHSPYNAAFQTDLDPVWMRSGFGENLLDDAFRQFSGSLILLLYDLNTRPRFDVYPAYSIHLYLQEPFGVVL